MKKNFLVMISILGLSVCGYPGKSGQWEIGYHYSYWSIDMISQLIEENFTPDFELYDPAKGDFNFQSNGNNWGLEIRFFPKGKRGSFSLGFSYERNNFKTAVDGSYTDYDNNGNRVDVEAKGSLEMFPHSANLSLRWELWPSGRVHPYIGLGIGVGPLNGNIDLFTKATTHYHNGYTYVKTVHEEKTLKEALDELEAEGNGFPLGVFPIVHLHFGLRGEVFHGVYLLAEAAVYDGFIARGGLAVRL